MIDRYTSGTMQHIWSDYTKYNNWMWIEKLAVQHNPKVPLYDKGVCFGLPVLTDEDILQIKELEQSTKHDVAAFVDYIEGLVGLSGSYFHYGLTSSDIVDTGFVLQLRAASNWIEVGLRNLCKGLGDLADKNEDVVMVGRTHGRVAQPLLLSKKINGFREEFVRHLHRFESAVSNISFCKLSGPVGSYVNIDPAVEKGVAESLHLSVEPQSTQIIPRDRFAEFFCVVAQIGASLERLALMIRLHSQSGIEEFSEGFGKNQKGSSAMPHKRNPIKSENICGLARLLRGYAIAALENVSLWDERDISHSSVERVIAPDATSVLEYMLSSMVDVVENLQVNSRKIALNLDLSRLALISESIMLKLISYGVSRKDAHKIVKDNDWIDYFTQKDIDQMYQEVMTKVKGRAK